jgi:uncharacterized membrane protein affecting hemolysin expression
VKDNDTPATQIVATGIGISIGVMYAIMILVFAIGVILAIL